MRQKARVASRGARRARSGLTMVEVLIAALMMSVLLGAVGLATLRGQAAFETGRTVSDLETRAQRALGRIADELRGAGRAGLQPDPLPPFGANALRYQVNVGFAGGAVQWSELRSIGFELEPGESADGTDEDGDGLIDEGRVVLTLDLGGANERRVVLLSGVRALAEGEVANGLDDDGNGLIDEAGLSFVAQGATLRIRLTVEGLDPEGRRITRSLETAIVLRN